MPTLREVLKSVSMNTSIYSKIINVIETEEEFSGLLGRVLDDDNINDLNIKLNKRKYVDELHKLFVDAFIGKISTYKVK